MRRLAMGTMLVLGLAAGCDKPIEGIPGPSGSGVSSGEDLSVQAAAASAAVEATAPAAETPSAETPAAEKPAETPAAEGAKPEASDSPAEPPKQSSAGKAGAVKFVADTSLKVPTMTCPHGCWPTVKETLVAQAGVEAVELAKQSNADSINNPIVYIKLKGKFDAKAAVDALAKAGFAKAEVVN